MAPRLSIPKNGSGADDTKPAPAAKKPAPKQADPVIEQAKKRFQYALEAESDNRKNYIADTKFSSSDDQWDDQAKQMRGPNRPALTFNRLNGVVKQIIGDYRQNKLAVKVLPANGDADEDTAEILAGLIRNIEQQSNADMVYTNALECSARGGFGYFRILPEYCSDDVFDQDLRIRPIHNPLTVYMDPSAKLITREDANWCFVTEMVTKEDFERLYPKATQQGFDSAHDEYALNWGNGDEVRVAEYFEKVPYEARLAALSNGMVVDITSDDEIYALESIGMKVQRERIATRNKVLWRKLTSQEVLESAEYKIRYIPIIRVVGEEVNIEGKSRTRSAVFYAKDAQKMLNYQKTTATEVVALSPKAPWLVTPEQIEGFQDQWNNANTSPAPYLPYNQRAGQTPPQRVQPSVQPVGEIAMAGDASVELQYTTGVFDATLGAQGQEVSGLAISERQNQGATSTFLFVDNLKKAIEFGGRILLDWIPSVYDAERVARTLDMEGNPKTVLVNEQKYDPMTGVTEVLNNLAVGKYDVVIDTGPNFASRRREALDAALKYAQIDPTITGVAGDLILKMIDAPGMEQVAERKRRSMPPELTVDPESPEGQQMVAAKQQQAAQQAQQQQEMVQAALDTEKGKQQAENAKSQAQVVKAEAEVIKAHADVIQASAKVAGAQATEAAHVAPQQPHATHPQHPVTIQLNAEHAMGDVASGVKEMVAHSAAQTERIAATLDGLAQAMHEHGRLNAHQTAMLHEVMHHTAASSHAVAQAVERGNKIAAAPRKAVRDPKTREITGHEIVMEDKA